LKGNNGKSDFQKRRQELEAGLRGESRLQEDSIIQEENISVPIVHPSVLQLGGDKPGTSKAIQQEKGNKDKEDIYSEIEEEAEKSDTDSNDKERSRSASPLLDLSEEVLSMTNVDVAKLVDRYVPLFYGNTGPDLKAEVNRFVVGCQLLSKDIPAGQQAKALELTKLRLKGYAHDTIYGIEFESLENLSNTVKRVLSSKRDLEDKRDDLLHCTQSLREPVVMFGARVEGLLNEALRILRNTWGVTDRSSAAEFRKLAFRTFVNGLRDQSMRQSLVLGGQKTILDLVEIVEKSQELLGAKDSRINYMSRQEPDVECSYCFEKGHLLVNCKKRFNTPLLEAQEEECAFCKTRGHLYANCVKRLNNPFIGFLGEVDHKNSKAGPTDECSFCGGIGHFYMQCKKRLNSPFCDVCGTYGHEKNQKCNMRGPTSSNDERQRTRPTDNKGRKVCDFCGKPGHLVLNCYSRQRAAFCTKCNTFGHEENQYCQNPSPQEGRGQERDQNSNAANFSCFVCKQFGHRANNCPNKQNANQGNSEGAGQSH